MNVSMRGTSISISKAILMYNVDGMETQDVDGVVRRRMEGM